MIVNMYTNNYIYIHYICNYTYYIQCIYKIYAKSCLWKSPNVKGIVTAINRGLPHYSQLRAFSVLGAMMETTCG